MVEGGPIDVLTGDCLAELTMMNAYLGAWASPRLSRAAPDPRTP